MLFLFFVHLCSFSYVAFHVEYCLALWSRVFPSSFSIVIISIGEERELVYTLFCEFVYFARVNFCPFSLPLGISG